VIDLSAVDVEDLLERLGVEDARMTAGGVEVTFSCPIGQHSHGGAAYINSETTAWMCHGCHAHGNAITLVMEVQQVERATAERLLREWYGIEFDQPKGGSMVAEVEARLRAPDPEPERTRPPRSWLLGARFDWVGGEEMGDPHRYMIERGFTPATLADWDIGYDFLTDRVTIPVFDLDGELFGIKARDWTGQRKPKYLVLGDRTGKSFGFAPYEASEVVFGLHRQREHRKVVVCEGEMNSIALDQLGVLRPAAIGMSYFSDRQIELLVREADEVVIYMDYGEAGHAAAWGRYSNTGKYHAGAVAKLEGRVRVKVVQPSTEDPAELVRLGRGEVALELIEQARSPLAIANAFG
jgi:DNA primase